MSEPHNEPNPSGSDPATGPNAPRPGPSAGANRFWEQYGEARRAGSRNGENGGSTGAGAGRAESETSPAEHHCLDWCPICRGAEVVRATTPPELRDQFESIQHDALAMIKALIDSYLAKQGESAAPTARRADRGVEDIPID
jgi:hypothetical protein